MTLAPSYLTSAASTANASLAAIANQTSIVSRNIAGASEAGYSRKTAQLVTGVDGAAHVTSITRSTNTALRNTSLDVTSAAASQQALADGYDKISASLDDTNFGQSPASAIAVLTNSLQKLSASPSSDALQSDALASAKSLAANLNNATVGVQAIRQQADADITASVTRINSLLAAFKTVDTALAKGTIGGFDVTADQDRRDQILSALSQEIGITTSTKANGTSQLYTDSGVVLFDREPRTVSFKSTATFAAGTSGNAVIVDGVDVTSSNSTQVVRAGAIVGLAALRDGATVKYQSQLDEVARGLINSFAESDQSATPTLADAPGLFTYPGAPALPGSSTVTGLAGSISVNPSVDPSQGGVVSRIRDGGSADNGNPAYNYNPSGSASFSSRTNALIAKLSTPLAFSASAGLSTTATLGTFSNDSISDVEAGRKAASDGATQQATLRDKTNQTLQSDTGVNLDDELSKLLDLEHAYGASAKLLSAVDGLYTTLFQALN